MSDNTANGNDFGFNVNASRSESGAVLVGATRNTLTRNTANRNASYGFAATEGANHNRFSSNAAHANGELDALEAWPAGGDTWVGNHFGTTSGI